MIVVLEPSGLAGDLAFRGSQLQLLLDFAKSEDGEVRVVIPFPSFVELRAQLFARVRDDIAGMLMRAQSAASSGVLLPDQVL